MADNSESTATSGGAKTRHRSPNYPAIGLPEAIDRVSRFYAADRKAGAPLESALKHMGFSGKHGKSMMVVSAIKKYGLAEDVAGRLVPTQRAVEIIVLAKDDPRRLLGIREAALSPDINRELFEQYHENGFPSESSLVAELVAYKGFNPDAAGGYARDFLQTMEFASLTNHVEVSLSEEHEESMVSEAENYTERTKPGDLLKQAFTTRVSDGSPSNNAHRFTWPLSKGIIATLEFSGGEVSAAHIDLLQKYLELAKLAVGVEFPEERGSREAES